MTYSFKWTMVILFCLFTWPLSLPARIAYRYFRSEIYFDFSAKLLSLVPGKFGQYLRTSFYVVTLDRCHADLAVAFGSFFSHPTAKVGRCVVVGSYSIIGTAVLGDGVLIASHVSILSGKHQHGSALKGVAFSGEVYYETVTIGAGSWIGEGAIIMASVGRQCIVGAGSVVAKPVPDLSTAVGNPARFYLSNQPTGADVITAPV
jgi:acetyltransferase-like isoleucine patch superfamily enzyme